MASLPHDVPSRPAKGFAPPRIKAGHLLELVQHMEAVLAEFTYNKQWTRRGHWDYCPLELASFFAYLDEAIKVCGKKSKAKYLEIGCGIGTKLHLAAKRVDAYGLELNPLYAAVAETIMRRKVFMPDGRYKCLKSEPRVIRADAATFDYAPYDIVYFYQPMKGAKERRFEKHLYESMKPGAILIPILPELDPGQYLKPISTPSGTLFRKQ